VKQRHNQHNTIHLLLKEIKPLYWNEGASRQTWVSIRECVGFLSKTPTSNLFLITSNLFRVIRVFETHHCRTTFLMRIEMPSVFYLSLTNPSLVYHFMAQNNICNVLDMHPKCLCHNPHGRLFVGINSCIQNNMFCCKLDATVSLLVFL
jgi:hypothetical protein